MVHLATRPLRRYHPLSIQHDLVGSESSRILYSGHLPRQESGRYSTLSLRVMVSRVGRAFRPGYPTRNTGGGASVEIIGSCREKSFGGFAVASKKAIGRPSSTGTSILSRQFGVRRLLLHPWFLLLQSAPLAGTADDHVTCCLSVRHMGYMRP